MASGEHTEPLREMDTELMASIQEKVAAKLSSTLAEEPEELEPPTPETVEDDSTEEEPNDDKVDDTDEGSSNDEPAGDQDESEEPTPDDEGGSDVEIPDSYIRAAIHSKWSMEDIKRLAKADPELAMKTFEKLYEATNSMSQQFSEIGRVRKQQSIEHPTPQPQPKPAKKKVEFQTLTKEQLETKFGAGDPMVDVILNQQNMMQAMADQINTQPEVQDLAVREQNLVARQTRVSSAEDRLIERQLNAFFQAEDMAMFGEVYGTLKPGQTWEDLAPGQERNRLDTIATAESIKIGADLSGYDMTMEDALLKAHLMLTDDYKASMIRKDIMGKVVKRSKSLTLKPSQSKRTVASDTGKPSTRAELLSRTRQRLKKVLG